MTEPINPFEAMSGIMEFNRINEFMEDPKIEKGLLKLTSILARPDGINPNHIARHIVECQALSAYYGIQAKFYMTTGKGEDDAQVKKGYYMTMREEFDKLANSLKYLAKT